MHRYLELKSAFAAIEMRFSDQQLAAVQTLALCLHFEERWRLAAELDRLENKPLVSPNIEDYLALSPSDARHSLDDLVRTRRLEIGPSRELLKAIAAEPDVEAKAMVALVRNYENLSVDARKIVVDLCGIVPIRMRVRSVLVDALDSGCSRSAEMLWQALKIDLTPSLLARFDRCASGGLALALGETRDPRAAFAFIKFLREMSLRPPSERVQGLIATVARSLESLLSIEGFSLPAAEIAALAQLPDLECRSVRTEWRDPTEIFYTGVDPSFRVEEAAVISLGKCRDLARRVRRKLE